MNKMKENCEEALIKDIITINTQESEIDKKYNVYRIQRENISDEIENIFSKYIAKKLNNDKLYYNIATSLTIEFIDPDVINQINNYNQNTKEPIIKLNKNNKTTFKPDLIIYKKENNKNIILALVEFKNDLGYTREIFGKKNKHKINKELSYTDIEYQKMYTDKYHKPNKTIKLDKYYGYKRKYIMEILNNVNTNKKNVYKITSKRRINTEEKIEIYEIKKPCKMYILSCSCNNCPIRDIKSLYTYDFCKNKEDKYIKFNTFFKESVRLDDNINKGKKAEEANLTLDDDKKIGYKNFIDELKKDIEKKI